MSSRPRLGGRTAVVLFILVLIAFTAQSDLTTYLQTTLGFRRPYFLFYVGHSSFTIVFPLHLLYLVCFTDRSARSYLSDLTTVFHQHFSPAGYSLQDPFPSVRVCQAIALMLIGVTGPALLWYCSVSMSSISDITALWNTNAFWAYLFAVKLFKLKFETRHILAVSCASIGTALIVYGGSHEESKAPVTSREVVSNKSHLFGNLLAFIASVWYGFFQVMYKRYIALPDEPDSVVDAAYEQLPDSEEAPEEFATSIPENQPMPSLPFGLFPNALLSLVGVATAVVLALPFPVLHYLEAEKFTFPTSLNTLLCIAGIAGTGLTFNAGFMILLGLWGPIITSVGGLLTIVLVLISDVLFVGGLKVLTFWTFLGSLSVVGGFAILAYELQR